MSKVCACACIAALGLEVQTVVANKTLGLQTLLRGDNRNGTTKPN